MGTAPQAEYRYVTRVAGVSGGRPIIKGTRTTVKAIVGYYKMGLGVEEILEGLPHLTPAQVHEALSYYHDHRDEIEHEIAEAGRVEDIVGRYGLEVTADGAIRPRQSDDE